MSAYDPDTINNDNDTFDQGESFGRHAARQELLPLLRGLRQELPRPQWGDAEPEAALWHSLNRVIANIERTPQRVTCLKDRVGPSILDSIANAIRPMPVDDDGIPF